MSLAIASQTAPQSQQVVDTRYTQDVIPVLDTSKFEHMHRIAKVMAMSSVIPETLRKGKGDDGKEVWLPEDVVVANCFRIVNQAVRWGMDPFAVADCASIVHGRLMWEGKLVAAVLDAKLGVNLQYEFFDEDKPEKDKALGVHVSATLPNETKPRTIEGTVAAWHKGDKSPWANPKQWKRQLRYMGAREWARAHKPSILLGIYTVDEIEGIMARDVPAGQRALRMKDVTPSKTAPLEIPDDIQLPPKETELVVQINADMADDTLADPEGFLAKLSEELALCTSVEELEEIKTHNAEMIARLPKSHKAKAEKMLDEAGE